MYSAVIGSNVKAKFISHELHKTIKKEGAVGVKVTLQLEKSVSCSPHTHGNSFILPMEHLCLDTSKPHGAIHFRMVKSMLFVHI